MSGVNTSEIRRAFADRDATQPPKPAVVHLTTFKNPSKIHHGVLIATVERLPPNTVLNINGCMTMKAGTAFYVDDGTAVISDELTTGYAKYIIEKYEERKAMEARLEARPVFAFNTQTCPYGAPMPVIGACRCSYCTNH